MVEPKPSANLVAEPTSAVICRGPPQAGSGRTPGCLFQQQAKTGPIQLKEEQGTAKSVCYTLQYCLKTLPAILLVQSLL